MKRVVIIVCLLVAVLHCGAQKVEYVGALAGAPAQSYQGMDVWGDYVVSCQNMGMASVYMLTGNALTRIGEPFRLGSYGKDNHANVASFGTIFYDKRDLLPLLYVSQAAKNQVNGLKDVLYVERVNPKTGVSQLVQTIYFADTQHLFGYALQWVVDRQGHFLYGYGNTVNNSDSHNRHRIVKFRIPRLSEGPEVVLTNTDVLENYLIESTYMKPFNPVGQGLFINNGYLFMPTGVGDAARPSLLYVWNLRQRTMETYDLTRNTEGELEDCGMHAGTLLIQSQKGLYRMDFQGK